MAITLTDLAKSKISEISESEGIGHKNIRLKLSGFGCSGWVPELEFTEVISEQDEIIPFDDIKIVVDHVSFSYLENATIDWLEQYFESGFKVNTPDSTGSCGCGKSISF
jgi:iron-sulfur cluster assembly accessory protein